MLRNRVNRGAAGFTLMELMAVIVAASIVTLAATTLMLFGLRSNTLTVNSMKQQNNARLLMETLENLSTKGTIAKVETGLDKNGTGSDDDENYWEILDAEDNVLYSYVSETATFYAGPRPDAATGVTGTVLMENVISFFADLSAEGVLTFSMETEEQTYTSSIYCRNTVKLEVNDQVVENLDQTINNAGNVADTGIVRVEFLRKLANQYKLKNGSANPGLILNADKTSTGQYYSEWYIGNYASNPGWNAMTPWCACYLSWALNRCAATIDDSSYTRGKWYASVDDFVAYFKAGELTRDASGNVLDGHGWLDNLEFAWVQPGDLIHFDWNLDNDPSHIGAVLMVDIDNERVYTIEGNTTNRVGVRSYKLSDPRILGYGVIDWAVPENS